MHEEPPSDPARAKSPTVIRIAVAAVVRRAGPGSSPQILIARRPDHAVRGGLWELPGGKFAPGEGPAEAAARELLEETGIRVDASAGAVLGVVRRADPGLAREASIELTVVRFEAPMDAAPRPIASVECRWESIDRLGRYEWPGANAEVNQIIAAHERPR